MSAEESDSASSTSVAHHPISNLARVATSRMLGQLVADDQRGSVRSTASSASSIKSDVSPPDRTAAVVTTGSCALNSRAIGDQPATQLDGARATQRVSARLVGEAPIPRRSVRRRAPSNFESGVCAANGACASLLVCTGVQEVCGARRASGRDPRGT